MNGLIITSLLTLQLTGFLGGNINNNNCNLNSFINNNSKISTACENAFNENETTIKINGCSKNTANLKIEKVDGADGYCVYRASSENGVKECIGNTKSGNFVDKNVNGKTCSYSTRAYKVINGKKVLGKLSNCANTDNTNVLGQSISKNAQSLNCKKTSVAPATAKKVNAASCVNAQNNNCTVSSKCVSNNCTTSKTCGANANCIKSNCTTLKDYISPNGCANKQLPITIIKNYSSCPKQTIINDTQKQATTNSTTKANTNTTTKATTNTTKTNTTTTATPKATQPTSPAKESATQYDSSFASQVLKLVNQERVKGGLQELTMSQALTAPANKRAQEIKVQFSHTRPNGTQWSTVLDEYNVSVRSAGENLAYGYNTPEKVVTGWMNSPGHRANIMNANFNKIGIGVYTDSNGTVYCTQLFSN